MKKEKNITFTVNEEDHRLLKVYCFETGRTIREVLREAFSQVVYAVKQHNESKSESKNED